MATPFAIYYEQVSKPTSIPHRSHEALVHLLSNFKFISKFSNEMITKY